MPIDLTTRRTQWRRDLLALRANMQVGARAEAERAIGIELTTLLADFEGVLGFYWPIQHEFDARPALTEWLAGSRHRCAVLPVVVKRAAPLKFREWSPATTMQSAGFGTSFPATGRWIEPDALLVPLVGFDDRNYRLGYGGGYYDRTLAALARRPDTTGIGFRICRLESIEPQSHDLKLDRLILG